MEHLHPYDFVRLVLVEHYAGRDFLRLRDRGVVEPQVKGVRLLVHV